MDKIPVKLSPAQVRKIRLGGAITLKPSSFVEGDATHAIKVLPATLRKVATANRRNKGVRLMFKPEEDVMDLMTGGSILGDIRKGFKKATKAVSSAGKKVFNTNTGKQIAKVLIKEGIPIATSALGSAIGSSLATVGGNPELAPVAGRVGSALGRRGGQELSKYVSKKTGYGLKVPIINGRTPKLVGPGGVRPMMEGEGFKPAGGNSGAGIITPAPSKEVIQLGSPYQRINSPAMSPFIGKSPQLVGRGFMPAGGY